MKKDFDYVMFTDYEKDMDELGRRATAAADALKHEISNAREMLAAAALSAGGEIEIHDGDLMRINLYDIVMWRDEARSSTRVSVKLKS